MNYPSNLHITQDLTLQMSLNEPNVIVKAKQGDRLSRYLALTFMYGEESFEIPQGVSVTLRVKKSDGKIATSVCTVESGKAIAELTDQMLSCVGRARADIVMSQGETTISCAPFYIDVHAAGATDKDIASTDDVRDICERLNDAADEKIAEMQKILIAAGGDPDIKAVSYDETKKLELSENLLVGITATLPQGWTKSGNTYTHAATSDMSLTFAPTLETGACYYLALTHNISSSTHREGDIAVALCDGEYLDTYNGKTDVSIVLKCTDGTNGALKIRVAASVACTISNIELRRVVESGEKKVTFDAFNILNSGALSSNKSGYWNVALGAQSLESNINGTRNIAVGSHALEDLESGNRNVALGTFALAHATNADRNIFIGADSGLYLEKADDCISIGKAALSQGVKRDGDIAIGAGALYGSGDAKNSDASKGNVGIGKNSGYYCYGKSNVFVGSNAGYNTSSGNMNVCIGNEAGRNLTDGWGNTAIGSNAYNVGNYSRSIAIGYNAVPTKSFQAVIGSDALVNETVLNGDIVIKGNAIKRMPSVKLEYNYTDSSNKSHSGETVLLKTEDIAKGNNVAIGNEALKAYALSDSDQGTNVAIGNQAGQDMTGLANVIIGRNAGLCRTGTNNNVMIGSNAGKQLSSDKTKTQGSELTLIGAGTSTAEVGFSKSIAIGWNSKVTKSNQAVIGTEQLVETVLHGDLIVVGTDGVKRRIKFNDGGTLGWEAVT